MQIYKNLDSIACQYTDMNTTMSVDSRLITIMARRALSLVHGPKVLEMGFGADAWTNQIIKKFGHSFLVDGSEILVKNAAKKYGRDLTVYKSNFEEFVPPVRFDSVLATLVLEHLKDPVSVMRRMKEWIIPGGQILIIVPNASSIHRTLGVCKGILSHETELSEADKAIGHLRVYTDNRLRREIRAAGFKLVKRLPTFIKFGSNSQLEQYSEKELENLFDLAQRLPARYSANIFFECTL